PALPFLGAHDLVRSSTTAFHRNEPGGASLRRILQESWMNLNLTGHHLDITPAIRDYVIAKLDRVTRHFDHVIDVTAVLAVDKLQQHISVNLHISGKDIHVECADQDMYAAIDAVADKLDRQVLKY